MLKRSYKLNIFLIYLLLNINSSYAQNFQWTRSFGTARGYEAFLDVYSDTTGGCALNLYYRNTLKDILDTLRLDSFHFFKPKDPTYWNILVKLDKYGKVIKAKKIFDGGYEVIISSGYMCRDASGNFFITKPILGTSTVFDSTTYYSKNGSILLVKLDENLNTVFVKQFGNLNSLVGKIFISEGHIFFKGQGRGTTFIGSKRYNFSNSKYNTVFGEINSNTGDIKWSNSFYDSLGSTIYTTILEMTGIVSLKNNIYVSGSCRNTFKVQKDSFGKGAFIFKLDSLGNYIKGDIALKGSPPRGGDTAARLDFMSSDGDKLYLSSKCTDSFIFINKRFPGLSPSSYYHYDYRLCSFNTDFTLNYIYQPIISDYRKIWGFLHNVTSKGYLYFSGATITDLDFQGIKIKSGVSYDVFFGKMDYKGNILWVVNSNSPSSFLFGIDALGGKFMFIAGEYRDKIKLGKDSLNSAGQEDAWISKLSDNSITRGGIHQGPYCAGDSIDVPYTKFGDFDTSNHFIAQLSDEYGRFDSVYFELGRLKSNTDGKVKGVLPNFKVKSSANYRIRILSTSPAVQSFFRIDTLRLLIYSIDKADPGPTDTICFGDSVQIQTYGGTRWSWNPDYNISHTNSREPLVWPLKTTTYRIIISDSSGCGAIDTGYKKIVVKDRPGSVLEPFTVVCDNSPLKIPAVFENGDSNYHWSWYYVSSSKWFLLKSDSFSYSDSLSYIPDVKPNVSEKLAIILRDECSPKADTAYTTILLRTPLRFKHKVLDTTVCKGLQLKYKLEAEGGGQSGFQWQWKDLTNNKMLSNSDSLELITDQSLKIQAIVHDGCLALADTSLFEIHVNPALETKLFIGNKLLNDTILCYGDALNIKSTVMGGPGFGYQYKWYLDNNLISQEDSLDLNTKNGFSSLGETKTLRLMVSDNCSPYPDSVLRILNVNPSPVSNFSWGMACSKTPVQFNLTGTVPANTSYNWIFPNGISNLKNPSQLLPIGKNTISLELLTSDGCKDEITKELEVLLQAKADFTADDVCEDSMVLFKNLSDGAKEYQWSFGDGQTSDSVSPKHLYSISGSTTFNVKLLAKSGCSDSVIKAVTIHEVPNSNFSYTTSGTQVIFNAIQTNANQYTWDFGDGGTRNTTGPQTIYYYDKFPSGKYKACLKVTNLAGCSSDTCIEIQVSGSVQSFAIGNKICVYPNPNSGKFNIDVTKLDSRIKLEIINSLGQTIYSNIIEKEKNAFDINLIKGIYNVRFYIDNSTYGLIMIVRD
ncbi:MAG: T9SS type A sorting domain-containing protein [Flavobacteriales bacterium]|nr:T9SS type A sorting domain-containing protein [Flavobacteriales bacterium]